MLCCCGFVCVTGSVVVCLFVHMYVCVCALGCVAYVMAGCECV